MKLSASNIGWAHAQDGEVYATLKAAGFTGLEIAPTRIFESEPYAKLGDARAFARNLQAQHGLEICSMQSIWFGCVQRLFKNAQEREFLLQHTKKAVLFAEACGCKNLVFGSPKNRNIGEGETSAGAAEFFGEIATFAHAHSTVIAMEANPALYGTNYICTTAEAANLVQKIANPGFKLNLDFGTVLANGEDLYEIEKLLPLVSHVHISEVNLLPPQRRGEHALLAKMLRAANYGGYVSIEMKAASSGDLTPLLETINYVAEVFS